MNPLPRVEESNSFGYWLRRRRKALDWTQADLARRVNCAAATIRKIEADERKPSRQLAELIATQLQVPSDQREVFLQAARRAVSPEILTLSARELIAARTPNNLPTPMTALVNRRRDIASVTALLTRDDVRLLTLIGLPGIGKTRLCLQSCDNVLAHFPDGVWFVDLAPIADAALVLPTIARALDIAESGALTPLQQLGARFGNKRVLLALDNFEQVLDAAHVVTDLLKVCPGLQVLVTSRVPLRVYGEHEYAVPPMSLPARALAPNRLIESEAAQLFLARVHEHQPGFAITSANAAHVADVCIRLDGVPLALELAAAALRRMSLEQLAASFSGGPNWLSALRTFARDLPARQQTLYNAIAWSYSLLDASTQSVFRQLGVFAGEFDAEAAGAICGAETSTLSTLTDHSLLAREPERWRMLEMIREFALEQMSADEHARVGQCHAAYFAKRLQNTAVDALERDHGNYRAALRWSIHQHDGWLAVTMTKALAEFWETRGYLREGLTLARQVLAISENVEPLLRLDLLSSVAHLTWNKHEFVAARELIEQSIVVARANGMEAQVASKLNTLARVYIEQGDYVRAESILRESANLAQQFHNTRQLAIAWTLLGEVALAGGRIDEAQEISGQALGLLENRIDRFIAMVHTNLAEVALAHGDYPSAREQLQRALPHIHDHIRRELCFLATLAGWLIRSRVRKEDTRRGVEVFGAVECLIERAGAPFSLMYRGLNTARLEIARNRLSPREFESAWNEGRGWTPAQLTAKIEQLLE